MSRFRACCTVTTLVVTSLCLSVGAAGAQASSSIEGVWSFNGGKVAIAPNSQGILVGTVVQPTTFAQCVHQVPEVMWKEMRLQPDGSYWGLHQWFYENDNCMPNPTLGSTAWRVMETANGGHFLRVCFSSPEAPTQPTIAPNGAAASDSYGCVGSEVESAHVASLPQTNPTGSSAPTERFSTTVSLPNPRQCASRRLLRIHLKDPLYDPIKSVLIRLGKHRLTVRRHGNVFAATIDLRNLPRGRFTVKILVTTVLGHQLSGSRTYHTCASKHKTTKPSALRRRR